LSARDRETWNQGGFNSPLFFYPDMLLRVREETTDSGPVFFVPAFPLLLTPGMKKWGHG
jgi:hypothetical protein